MCQFYRLSDMVGKARDFGNEVAAKTAQQAAKIAAKAKEGWKNRGKKGMFAKALKWTRELAQDVIEEYKSEVSGDKSVVNEGDKSVVNESDKNRVNESDKNKDNGTTDETHIDDANTLHLFSLSEQDLISLDQLRENPSVLMMPIRAITAKSGKGASLVALEKQTIVLMKTIGGERAVIEELKDVKTIAEMKLVKEEADTLAITFGAEAKEMWTVQLEDAVKLQNAISSALVESE